MSIERAEADLARAKAELLRLRGQMEAASAKVMKLEHYLEITRAYEAEGTEDGSVSRSAGAALAAASIEIIHERGCRQKTSALVEELEKRGHNIGGRNKITNLSGALSRAPELSSNRTEGWGLAAWPESGDYQPVVVTVPSKAKSSIMEKLNILRKAAELEPEPEPEWEPLGDLDAEIPF